MANLGIGIGAFASGLAGGIGLGKQIKSTLQDNQINKLKKQGMEDARKSRNEDIASGGQAQSIQDYYMQNSAPKIRDMYLEQGKEEQVMAWDKWINDRNTQKGMKHWSDAVKSIQSGDSKTGVDHLVKAINTQGYTNGDLEVLDYKKREDGTFEFTTKDQDGNKNTQEFKDITDLANTAMMVMSPDQSFESILAKQQAADAQQAKMQELQAKYDKDLAFENAKQTNRVGLAGYRVDKGLQAAQEKHDRGLTSASQTERNRQAGITSSGGRGSGLSQKDANKIVRDGIKAMEAQMSDFSTPKEVKEEWDNLTYEQKAAIVVDREMQASRASRFLAQ